jgi:hypothetical protein
MSQVTEKYIATNEYERVVSMTCDLCGKTVRKNQWDCERGNNVMEIEISIEEGWHYGGDGGRTEKYEYDICPQCFRGKLMVWLAEQGAKPRLTEHDW